MVAGTLLESAEAKAAGFVDELVASPLVVPAAIGWLGELLALPPVAMTETRRIARADLVAVFRQSEGFRVDDILDLWFAPEAQAVLTGLVARLRSKR
jgi:enoyl-CoA hydratase/carnithine racemase